MQAITPFLWFNGNAEDAANFYMSIFPNSKEITSSRYGPEGPGPEGSLLLIKFELNGHPFFALNGGPEFTFTPATSFMVDCENQEEVDHLWNNLAEGGKEIQCGWVTDKFGVTWQIVPTALGELMSDPDPEKRSRVMQAMFGMVKLDIAGLRAAYEGN
jgi:predicted 3-demethylubiquinone-9 3-methyltransferase (glyoxalase superfamily)